MEILIAYMGFQGSLPSKYWPSPSPSPASVQLQMPSHCTLGCFNMGFVVVVVGPLWVPIP